MHRRIQPRRPTRKAFRREIAYSLSTIAEYATNNKVVGVYESLAEMALTTGAKNPRVFEAIVATWSELGELQAKASTSWPTAC